MISGGLLKERLARELRQSRWSRFRRQEISRVRKLLRKKLVEDGYHLRRYDDRRLSLWRRRGIDELSESFSISIGAPSDKHTAQELLEQIVRLMNGRDEDGSKEDKEAPVVGRDVFSLTSEAGDGKAVLGMLLPLLCHRSPSFGCAALYLSPSSWDLGVPTVKKRVLEWLKSWPDEQLRLLVIDSADDRLSDPAFKSLVGELRELPQYRCGFLFLLRPATPGKTGNTTLALEKLFPRQPLEIHLHFDPAQAAQCRVFRHLFLRERLDEYQISHLLLAYVRLFPGYTLTRFSTVLVLRHLIETFREVAVQAKRLPIRPPGEVLFDGILFPQVDPKHRSIELVSQIALDLMRVGRSTATETLGDIAARLREASFFNESPADDLKAARSYLLEHSAVRLELSGTTMRIPNELHVRALAALRISHFIAAGADPLSPGLKDLLGRSRYDSCAPFLLPAYRRIWEAQKQEHEKAQRYEDLYRVMSDFLGREDAPFSLCASVIHSNYDFTLISRERTEELNRALFQTLVKAIDADRRTTCHQSIRNSLGPNPLLDQLFEVVAAYGDSVVQLLVDHVLLTSKEDLEKSQGAYLILAWLHGLFASNLEETLERRHHIYTILNGLLVLSTRNLHVRFHVMEVLDALTAYRGDPRLQGLPGLEERRRILVERFSGPPSSCVESPSPLTAMAQARFIYDECNSLVGSWAEALGQGRPSALVSLQHVDDRLPGLLLRFEQLLRDLGIRPVGGEIDHVIDDDRLEMILECYEVLLGLTRRAYLRLPKLALRHFIDRAADCPFWIVRWWAFYNMSRLVRDLPQSRNDDRRKSLDWMLEKAYRGGEPIGLKHRQVTLLKELAEGDKIADVLLQQLSESRGPLDKAQAQIADEYAKVQGRVVSGELDEYFGRLRQLRSRYTDPNLETSVA